jgi:hypothetical protein
MIRHYINKNGVLRRVPFDEYLQHLIAVGEKGADVPFDEGGRRVCETTLPNGNWLSTVYLGIDHGFRGPPVLFETMLFASKGPEIDDDLCKRYHTVEEARAGHERIVKELTK